VQSILNDEVIEHSTEQSSSSDFSTFTNEKISSSDSKLLNIIVVRPHHRRFFYEDFAPLYVVSFKVEGFKILRTVRLWLKHFP